ncbi:hypothetical protein FUAX_20310 [Fulvitalea axinellae]|uniref:Uncharacterized protein n=1 Tax=Fulvitalea axinellae TaxID=1182444 RepID=A0AAU9CBU7_9BACT|nr:hypothetical protein FUAX_20310 [Fulvitalea axinellae]
MFRRKSRRRRKSISVPDLTLNGKGMGAPDIEVFSPSPKKSPKTPVFDYSSEEAILERFDPLHRRRTLIPSEPAATPTPLPLPQITNLKKYASESALPRPSSHGSLLRPAWEIAGDITPPVTSSGESTPKAKLPFLSPEIIRKSTSVASLQEPPTGYHPLGPDFSVGEPEELGFLGRIGRTMSSSMTDLSSYKLKKKFFQGASPGMKKTLSHHEGFNVDELSPLLHLPAPTPKDRVTWGPHKLHPTTRDLISVTKKKPPLKRRNTFKDRNKSRRGRFLPTIEMDEFSEKELLDTVESPDQKSVYTIAGEAYSSALGSLADSTQKFEFLEDMSSGGQATLHGFALIDQLLAMKKAFGGDHKGEIEEAVALFSGGGAILGAISSGANAISSLAEGELSETVSNAGTFFSGLSSVCDTVGKLISIIKRIRSLAHKVEAHGEEVVFEDAIDYVTLGLQISKELVGAAKDAASAAKGFMDIAGAVTSTVGQVVPGLGIAVSTIDIAVRSVALARSIRSVCQVGEMKVRMKEYFVEDADLTDIIEKTRGTNVAALRRISFEHYPGTFDEDIVKEAQRFYLIRGLKKINMKRAVREAIKIGLDASNIASNIIKLSGVAAGAGLALDIGNALASGALVLFRDAKQIYHDWTEHPEKSTEQKHLYRTRQIQVLFSLINDMQQNPDPEEQKNQFLELKILFNAAGISLDEVVHAKDNQERIRAIYKALRRRE